MNKSESITELALAIIRFNSKVTKIAKDAANPFFKNRYATLDNIIDDVRPLLAAEGLAVLQFTGGNGENVTVKNLLLHDSGEWLESDVLEMKPVKNDPQGVGSCVTYARRYSLSSFLTLNTGEDDDGNAATFPNGKPLPKETKNETNNTPKVDFMEECKRIFQEIKGNLDGFEDYYDKKTKKGDSQQSILDGLNVLLQKNKEGKADARPVS